MVSPVHELKVTAFGDLPKEGVGVEHRNTKIVCTAGPTCHTAEQVSELMLAGANVFRLNFSHADHSWHSATLQTIREQAEKLDLSVAVMQDLCGPKMRLSHVASNPCLLVAGDRIRFTTAHHVVESGGNAFDFDLATTYEYLLDDVSLGTTLLLDDGRVELQVVEKQDRWIDCDVVRGGSLHKGKGLNLPGVSLSTESMTTKDWADLEWGIANEVDFIALSFVRHPEDLVGVHERLAETGSAAHLIAKIERPEAIDHIEQIIDLADGLMVARGDLGLETELARVPLLQKRLIERCRSLGKPVITATQMLESMVQNATPTRAEVSDVANAIYDGTSAIMLSGETAQGQFPRQAVEVLHDVALVSESDVAERFVVRHKGDSTTASEAIVEAAAVAALNLEVRRVVVYTRSGDTARLIARYRLPMPVVAVTNSRTTYRQMSLIYGVEPLHLPHITDIPQLLAEMDQLVHSRQWAATDDELVVVSALDGRDGTIDTLHIHRVRG